MRNFKRVNMQYVILRMLNEGDMAMKKLITAFLVFSIISTSYLSVYAADVTSSVSKTTSEPKVENLISLEYGKLLLDDSWHILSAPTRWNKTDWILAGLGTGAVVATAAWADKPIEEEFRRQRTKNNDDFAKATQPFGAEYSFVVLGALELGGIAFHDDNARATAQDGLASSLVAAGIITPALKYVIGRSRPSKDKGSHHFSPFSGDASFPSGHATQAFAVASVIAEHYDSPLIKIGSYAVASMVAYARMERRAHWASDVLAGALIGTVVGRTIVHFNREKRYELSLIADEDMVGVQVSHAF